MNHVCSRESRMKSQSIVILLIDEIPETNNIVLMQCKDQIAKDEQLKNFRCRVRGRKTSNLLH